MYLRIFFLLRQIAIYLLLLGSFAVACDQLPSGFQANEDSSGDSPDIYDDIEDTAFAKTGFKVAVDRNFIDQNEIDIALGSVKLIEVLADGSVPDGVIYTWEGCRLDLDKTDCQATSDELSSNFTTDDKILSVNPNAELSRWKIVVKVIFRDQVKPIDFILNVVDSL